MKQSNLGTTLHFIEQDIAKSIKHGREYELMLAIFKTVINDLQKSGNVKLDAIKYIKDESKSHLYSFERVCDYLDLNSSAVRKSLISQYC